MQRVAALLMLLCYAALGSGAVEYWHNQQHAAQDEGSLAVATADPGSAAVHHDHVPLHDESNCPIHLQLHFAGLAVAWVPLLICLGLFVAFLTMLAPVSRGRRIALAIPCRGPPAR